MPTDYLLCKKKKEQENVQWL